MGHFAKVENGTVTQVIVAEQDFINTGAVGDPSTWKQTSYNTRVGFTTILPPENHPQIRQRHYARTMPAWDMFMMRTEMLSIRRNPSHPGYLMSQPVTGERPSHYRRTTARPMKRVRPYSITGMRNSTHLRVMAGNRL